MSGFAIAAGDPLERGVSAPRLHVVTDEVTIDEVEDVEGAEVVSLASLRNRARDATATATDVIFAW